MNQLQTVSNAMFGNVEIVMIDGKAWFGATQVAKALGYAEPEKAIRTHCRKQGVSEMDTPTAGGIQKVKFIDEGNVYRLIVRSRLPEAQKFESWVFDEVLPSIRRYGFYMTPEARAKLAALPDEATYHYQLPKNAGTAGERISTIDMMREDIFHVPADEIARRCGIYTLSRNFTQRVKPHGQLVHAMILSQLIKIEPWEVIYEKLNQPYFASTICPKIMKYLADHGFPQRIMFGRMAYEFQFIKPKAERGYYTGTEREPWL